MRWRRCIPNTPQRKSRWIALQVKAPGLLNHRSRPEDTADAATKEVHMSDRVSDNVSRVRDILKRNSTLTFEDLKSLVGNLKGVSVANS